MFEEKMPNPVMTVEEIKRSHGELRNVLKVRQASQHRHVTQGWKTSAPRTIKVNCDAS